MMNPRCNFSRIFTPEGRQAYRVVIETYRKKIGAETLEIAIGYHDGDDWNTISAYNVISETVDILK